MKITTLQLQLQLQLWKDETDLYYSCQQNGNELGCGFAVGSRFRELIIGWNPRAKDCVPSELEASSTIIASYLLNVPLINQMMA